MNAVVHTTQNWQACLQLKLIPGQDKTRLVPIKRYGPLSVQRPFYPEQDVCHVYLLHPPGGVVGGDRLDLLVDLESSSKALFTTPGATKFYLSAGEFAQLKQQLTVCKNAQLEYLPQENIYFPGALVKAKTTLQVEQQSSAIVWEKHCFGRPVNNEDFSTGQLISELAVRSEKKLLFTEKQRINAAEIKRVCGLRDHPVSGSMLVFSDRLNSDRLNSDRLNKGLLNELRLITPLDGISGITQPIENLLVTRYMGFSTAALNDYFIKLLKILRPIVFNREYCHPRIWNT